MFSRIRTVLFLILMLSLIIPGCRPGPTTPEIVFKNVNVIPMTEETILVGYSIVVKNGKIRDIDKFDDLKYGPDAQIIDAEGQYLLPGFSDMHVHIVDPQDRVRFLASGVTLVRNMWGTSELLVDLEYWQEQNLPGPEVYTTGPLIDGKGAVWVGSLIIEDPAEVAEIIRQMKTDGYRAIKVYDTLSLDVYDEIIRQADRVDLPVVGHVPFTVGVAHVIEAGQLSIEHVMGYNLTNNTIDAELIQLTIESGVWHCPTLVAVPQRVALFEVLYENGLTRIVSGTDAGIAYIHHGSSLHEEFQRLHAAGLSPYEVLLSTTRNAAEMLGYENRLGTIEVGKEADLVLLEENPLDDIANTTMVIGVMTKGIWFSGEQLQDILDEFSQREHDN